jgi:hypothetical protein
VGPFKGRNKNFVSNTNSTPDLPNSSSTFNLEESKSTVPLKNRALIVKCSLSTKENMELTLILEDFAPDAAVGIPEAAASISDVVVLVPTF